MTQSPELRCSPLLAYHRHNGTDPLHYGNLIDFEHETELLLESEDQMHLLQGIPSRNRVRAGFEADRPSGNLEGARDNVENPPLDLIHYLNPVR